MGYPRVTQPCCLFMEKERSSDMGLPWSKNLQELRESFVCLKVELRHQDLTLFFPQPLLGKFQILFRFCWKAPKKFLLVLICNTEISLMETQSFIIPISLHNNPKRSWHLSQVLLYWHKSQRRSWRNWRTLLVHKALCGWCYLYFQSPFPKLSTTVVLLSVVQIYRLLVGTSLQLSKQTFKTLRGFGSSGLLDDGHS